MEINCPACEGSIQVGQDLFGEALACPHCDHLFQLTAKGAVTEYAEPGAAGASKKPMFIGIGVAVAVLAGFIGLMMSGGDPVPEVAKSSPSTASSTPVSTPEPADAGSDVAPPPGMEDSAVNEFLGMDGASSPPVEPMPPVEIPDTPDGTVTAVMSAMADGNPRGPWDALPSSYQSEINSLIHEYAEVVDPIMWDKGFSVANRVANVLADKQEFIFGNQRVAMQMATNRQANEIKAAYPKVVGLLTTLLGSDIASREKLKTLDVGEFLGTTGAQLFGNVAALAALSPTNSFATDLDSLREVSAKVLSTEGDTVELEISAPGQTNQVEKMKQVEGRWIPVQMADEWEEGIKKARAGLEQMKAEKQAVGMQAQMMLGMVEGVLAQFENANNQQDFDMALQGVMGMAMGAMQGGGPGGPGGQGSMQGGPPGFGPPPGMGQGMQGGQFPPPGQKGQRPPPKKR